MAYLLFAELSFSEFRHVTVLVAVCFTQTVGTSPLYLHWERLVTLLLASWGGSLGTLIQVGKAARRATKK